VFDVVDEEFEYFTFGVHVHQYFFVVSVKNFFIYIVGVKLHVFKEISGHLEPDIHLF
jgi:hypothetical protein